MKWILICLISGIILFLAAGPTLALTRFTFIGHVYPRLDQLPSIIKQINTGNPDFIVFGGDVIPGKNSDLPTDQQWQWFLAALQFSRVPIFFVPGNHDLDFNQYFPSLPFAFDYRGSRFIFIDTNSANYPEPFNLPAETIDFISRQTKEFGGIIFLFLHHAVWLQENKPTGINAVYPAKNWPVIENNLKGKQVYVFSGDGNRPLEQSSSGINYLVSGVTDYLSTEPAKFITVEIDNNEVNFRSVVLPQISWYKRLWLILENYLTRLRLIHKNLPK